MRTTLRLSLVGTVILVLLGGLAGTAVARTDGSTKVTGTGLSSAMGQFPEFSEDGVTGEDWVGHGRGMASQVRFEWSDPRLPSQANVVGNFEAYGEEMGGDVGAVVVNQMWLLEGPDGYWTGPWTGWCDDQDRCRATVTLTGYGAYDGFYAVLTEQPQKDENGKSTQVFEGVILHGDMPPMPDPLEPTAE